MRTMLLMDSAGARDAGPVHHGWRASRIEALPGSFARDEAKKAIQRLLARSPAAVAARQPRSGRRRNGRGCGMRSRGPKLRKARRTGTYKHSQTGDGKMGWENRKKLNNLAMYGEKGADKVERKGPGACSGARKFRRHAERRHLRLFARRPPPCGARWQATRWSSEQWAALRRAQPGRTVGC